MSKTGRIYRVAECTERSLQNGEIGVILHPHGYRMRRVRIEDISRDYTFVSSPDIVPPAFDMEV